MGTGQPERHVVPRIVAARPRGIRAIGPRNAATAAGTGVAGPEVVGTGVVGPGDGDSAGEEARGGRGAGEVALPAAPVEQAGAAAARATTIATARLTLIGRSPAGGLTRAPGTWDSLRGACRGPSLPPP